MLNNESKREFNCIEKIGLSSLDNFKIDDFWERSFLIVFYNNNIIVIGYEKMKVNIEK